MRQAGRYLPEYRALRQRHSLLELCHKPELAAQVTLQPDERLVVDAAILFADILLPFEPLGLGLSFSAGEGPQITRPIREAGQVLELPPVDPATDLAYVMEAARAADQALHVQRAACVARAHAAVRRARGRLSGGPGPRRRTGPAAVRQLGGLPVARRLRDVRLSAQ